MVDANVLVNDLVDQLIGLLLEKDLIAPCWGSFVIILVDVSLLDELISGHEDKGFSFSM
jgi:hypothetical protein